MQVKNSPHRYGSISLAFHWSTAALVIIAWGLGSLGEDFPRGPARAAALFAHNTAGLAVLALVIMRLIWRLLDPPPRSLGTALGVWGDRSGRVMHYVLLVLLAAVPAVGIALQFARGDSLPLFGLYEIASPWAADRAFSHSVKEVHEALANALVLLAGLHALAALAHHWLLKDGTLLRMLPWIAGTRRA